MKRKAAARKGHGGAESPLTKVRGGGWKGVPALGRGYRGLEGGSKGVLEGLDGGLRGKNVVEAVSHHF